MNIAKFQRFGLKRSKPLESSLVTLAIGQGTDGAVRLEWHDEKGHELIMLIHDQRTLERLSARIEKTLKHYSTHLEIIKED